MKYIYIPSNLNLKERIEESSFITDVERKHLLKYIDRVWYFISYLLYENDNINDNIYYYINVNYETICGIITEKTYRNLIKFLLEEKIIERDNSYLVGKYSKSYRLNIQYLKSHSNRYKIQEQKLIDALKIKSSRNFLINKTIYNLNKIRINYGEAFKIIGEELNKKERKGKINNNKYSYNITQHLMSAPMLETLYLTGSTEGSLIPMLHLFEDDNLEGNDMSVSDEIFLNLIDSFEQFIDINDTQRIYLLNHYKFCLIKMMEGNYKITIDRTENRLHSPITNMAKELRSCFFLNNGNKLVNVDIRNSQPFLFNSLLNDVLFGEDITLWKELTSSGQLYEYLMKKWNIDITIRDRFKVQFFKNVFYSEKNKNKYSEMFKKDFPNVYAKILEMKKENHANLPIQMGRIESKIMIFDVLNKIYEYDEIFALSVHDSIICEEENIDIVKQRIFEAFEKYDMKPTLKVEKIN